MLRGAVLASVVLWIGVPAHAITPVAQDRHVFGQREDGFGNLQYALGFPGTETYSASNYAPFSASTDGWSFPPQVGEGAQILASQGSTIGADQLDASGNTESEPYNAIDGEWLRGESVYSVTFQLDAPRPYTLSGQIDLVAQSCWGTTQARIRLTGPSGVLAQVTHQLSGYIGYSDQIALPLSTTLLLPAGTYTLEARGRTDALGGYGTHTGPLCAGQYTSHYEVHLAPAAPEVPALPGALAPVLALALAGAAYATRRR